MDQRSCQSQFLLHPSGKGSCRSFSKFLQPGKAQQVLGALFALGFRDIEDLPKKVKVLPHGHIAIQAEALRQVAELLACSFHLSWQLESGHADLPAGGLKNTHHQADRSGLASAVRTDQANHFT